MEPLALILIAVAVLAGIALGSFLGSRPVAEWKARHAERDTEAKEHETQFKQAAAELGQARIEIATPTRRPSRRCSNRSTSASSVTKTRSRRSKSSGSMPSGN